MSFSAMKKNRANALKDLQSSVAELNSGKKANYAKDNEGYWKPTVDKAGNGFAIIRPLPMAEGEDSNWVRYWDHGFKGPTGRWYIEKSLTTIGQDDPVSDHNSQLWATGLEEDKQTARDRKRRLHYVINILVVSDPANADNEGKVFKYAFGKKIFDKFVDKMSPEFQDEVPQNPFDFWEGMNLKLKIRNVEGYRNYDKSEFENPSEVFDGDEARLEELYNKIEPLSTLVSPDKFKSYAELKKKFNSVIGVVESTKAPVASEPVQKERAEDLAAPVAPEVLDDAASDDDDDAMSYFQKLAAQS